MPGENYTKPVLLQAHCGLQMISPLIDWASSQAEKSRSTSNANTFSQAKFASTRLILKE